MISDLASVIGAVVSLVLLGLATGFSPSLIALQVAVLGSEGRAGVHGRVVAAGVATGALLLTALFQVFNPDAWSRVLRGKVETFVLQQYFDEVAGVLFVIAGIWVLRHRRPEDTAREPHRPARVGRGGRRELFGFAVATTVISVSGAASTYLVVRLAREDDRALMVQLLVYLGFAAAAAFPYLLMVWAQERLPALATATDRMVAWVRSRRWRTLGGWALVVVGVLLFVAALTDYFGLR
jgi:putative Ca2+/H+ antiporter (TMEM165/GDT1 family)